MSSPTGIPGSPGRGGEEDAPPEDLDDGGKKVNMEGYELGAVLGSGGFSEVRSARKMDTGENFAVKVGWSSPCESYA